MLKNNNEPHYSAAVNLKKTDNYGVWLSGWGGGVQTSLCACVTGALPDLISTKSPKIHDSQNYENYISKFRKYT